VRHILWKLELPKSREYTYSKVITCPHRAETLTWTKADISRLTSAAMRFVKKYRRTNKKGENKQKREHLEVNTSEGSLTNNRLRWHGHGL
jgi:hypothetical protein